MRNFLQYFYSLIFVALIGCSSADQYSKEIIKVDKLVSNTLETNNLPGLSLTIVKDGNKIYSKGFGYADIDKQIQVLPSKTKFRIGSFSKTLAASALMKLVEEGKIDLDASIYNYVPDYPKKKWDFTSRQIAGHLSGIRSYNEGEMMINENFSNVKDALNVFKMDSLLHKPDTKYHYSTHAWTLLSLIIENTSGQSFLNYMQTDVFDKLNMNNTHAEKISLTDVEKVNYYMLDSTKQIIVAPEVDNSWKWAGGGFISTTEDVAKFLLAHSHNGYLTQESLTEMISPQKNIDGEITNYGIGWRTRYDKNNNTLIGHTGGSIGGTTYAFMAPHSNTIIVMTTNLSNASFGNLPDDLFELFNE
ncbi:MAG: D-alanyl-D-alanine carboxypeptidase [Flavobacteriaceae bacterium]|nr:D-alanyl-D-alanine carboxypeptidase [Flavobacteriaceae bacterium]|tara:strand:+ start:2078 stop:3157 length:1080 start_codon:yes stop_codon:yes gene_type:complete